MMVDTHLILDCANGQATTRLSTQTELAQQEKDRAELKAQEDAQAQKTARIKELRQKSNRSADETKELVDILVDALGLVPKEEA